MIEALRSAPHLLLDSNLLVLFLVGSLDRRLIGSHKRARSYTFEDFDLLSRILASKRQVVTTPNVLTETSNLVAQTGQPNAGRLLARLGLLCQRLDERYLESATVARSGALARLGLTDTGLCELTTGGLLLLTDDLPLYVEVLRLGGRAVNFNHIRTQVWS